MARKNYSEEFRRQAVDLYESTPGATVRGIAEDLGIVRGTLRHWLEAYGTGKKTSASLVEDALKAAAATRGLLARSIFTATTGRSGVYTSKDYAKLCNKLGVTQSMGAVGSSADNALAEPFNATLKREVLQDATTWPDELTCRRQVFR